jgi:PAS domain S-box-containing protein
LYSGQKIICIADAGEAEEIFRHLQAYGFDARDCLRSGQLNVLSAADAYMRDGVFDPDGMISLLEAETARALVEGYAALRVAGEMSWALRGLRDKKRLIEYETKLNEFFLHHKCLAICQYDRRRFEPEILLNVLATHPIAVVGTRIYDNFSYLPPGDFLSPDPGKARLNSWLHNLEARKRTEESLRKSEARCLGLFENAGIAIFRAKSDGRILDVNPGFARIFGYDSPKQVKERVSHAGEIFADQGRWAELLQRLQYETALSAEGLYRRMDGSTFIGMSNLYAEKDDHGNIAHVEGFIEDITVHRQVDEALRKSEEKFRTLAQFTHDWEYWTDLEYNYLYISPSVERITGYRIEEFLEDRGLHRRIIHPDDRAMWDEHLRVHTQTEKTAGFGEIEFRIINRDGDVRWISHICRPMFDGSGAFLGRRVSNRDISLRKIAEEELRRAHDELEQRVKERTFELTEANQALVQEIAERTRAEESLRSALEEIGELKNRLEMENIYLRGEIEVKHKYADIIGQSDAIMQVLSQVELVSITDSTVLLIGETGTGKELIACAIHNLSSRKDKPMIKVNCAALPATLIESELFGHEKGAYTGALSRKTGRFEIADGSTIFLDEISELPLELQAKLLRVLQSGEFERLGSSHTIRVNVRVIAATNRDLSSLLKKGTFREDLYYRLNVFPITLPQLRERREDIPLLVWSFVKEFEKTMGKTIDAIPKKCMEALQQYSWPGNVRELRNVIERAMIISKDRILQLQMPDTSHAEHGEDLSFEGAARNHIIKVLQGTGWRIKGKQGAAEILGMRPSTLQSKMKRLGIQRSDARRKPRAKIRKKPKSETASPYPN